MRRAPDEHDVCARLLLPQLELVQQLARGGPALGQLAHAQRAVHEHGALARNKVTRSASSSIESGPTSMAASAPPSASPRAKETTRVSSSQLAHSNYSLW